jgi:predicted Fe-Mo cluster-binding NifX family protein
MKIAVPVTRENNIDSHFGHCESYNVYSVSENNEITNIRSFASPQGCGCKSDIATVFAADGVTIMLAGGIGDGAINVLGRNGIEVIRGCSGNATEVVKQFLSGSVADSGSSCQQHNDHHHDSGHQCNHN